MNPWNRQEEGSHYKSFEIQPAYFCYKNNLSFMVGNVIKYVCRNKKDKLGDLKKAKHYLELLIYEEEYKQLSDKLVAKKMEVWDAGLGREGVGCDTEGNVQESGEAFYKPEGKLHQGELVSGTYVAGKGTRGLSYLAGGIFAEDFKDTKEESRDGSGVDITSCGVVDSYQEYMRGNCGRYKY